MSSKTKKLTFAQKVSKHKQLIPFVLPAILFALIFCYLPMAGIVIAFKDNPNFMRYDVFEALQRADWTLEHFEMIFSDPEIFRVVRNTLIISVMKIVILFPMPVILAVMITELRNQKFSKLVQGLVFLPHFFSWVVIVGIFNSLFGLYGPINNIVEALGAGQTVIASNVKGHKDILGGGFGFLFKLDDKWDFADKVSDIYEGQLSISQDTIWDGFRNFSDSIVFPDTYDKIKEAGWL